MLFFIFLFGTLLATGCWIAGHYLDIFALEVFGIVVFSFGILLTSGSFILLLKEIL
jgi:hypothetical protein